MFTLEEILDIPGNRDVYSRLRTMLEKRRAMAFVGAGASFPLYPLWNQLLKRLAHEPVLRGLAVAADEDHWLRTAALRPLIVASLIRDQLGDALFETFLHETFKDREGDDGLGFTPAQAAIVRAGFAALITTNYDNGLVEARRHFFPELRDTSFTVWNNARGIQSWLTGEIADQSCPILFAHGHFGAPENIVLDKESYDRAYTGTPYRRLFENLWIEKRLVFVGFSFNDVVLIQIADQVLTQIVRVARMEPRHIAIIGLPTEQAYTPEMRRDFLKMFDAYALFYPVTTLPDGSQDHQALQVLLDSLVDKPAVDSTPMAARPVDAGRALKPISHFAHETTEDESFTGRQQDMARLDRWAADVAVRLIGVTAIGGLGKTALVGHWLRAGRHHREAVFFWSFYRERDTNRFFEELRKFGRDQLGWDSPESATTAELLKERRIVVALDGLEVIQESPGTIAYGKLLEVSLAEFFHEHCRSQSNSLLVLTSRFPFPDLTSYLGMAIRLLPLSSLRPEEGAALLTKFGVNGRLSEREQISRTLLGHPLALRVFALSLPAEARGDPSRLWNMIAEPSTASASSWENQPFEDKLKRLLAFYEERLPEPQRETLSLIALFHAPVTEATLALLWHSLRGHLGADTELPAALNALHDERLLTTDLSTGGKVRYACHPILRDFFRARLLDRPELARDAAAMLAGPPGATAVHSLEEAQTAATAIELLLDAGDLRAAHDLYQARLRSVLRRLPAPHWGVEVIRLFVKDDARRREVEHELGPGVLGDYLTDLGFHTRLSGEPEVALPFLASAEAIDRGANDRERLCIRLQYLGNTEVPLGLLDSARTHFSEALEIATALGNAPEMRDSRSYIAWVDSLRGAVESADTGFTEASQIECPPTGSEASHYRRWKIYWVEHLLRLGFLRSARELIEENREACAREEWNDEVARCEWLLAWIDTLEGNWTQAQTHLKFAKDIFTAGHLISELARTLITEAECLLGAGTHEAALAACERALELAAPRNFRLIQADALNIRARLALATGEAQAAQACDDAEAALHLAQQQGYAWAQREASATLVQCWDILGNDSEAQSHRQRLAEWSGRLRLATRKD